MGQKGGCAGRDGSDGHVVSCSVPFELDLPIRITVGIVGLLINLFISILVFSWSWICRTTHEWHDGLPHHDGLRRLRRLRTLWTLRLCLGRSIPHGVRRGPMGPSHRGAMNMRADAPTFMPYMEAEERHGE